MTMNKRTLLIIACLSILLSPSKATSQTYAGFPESFDGTTFPPTGWSTILWYNAGNDGGGCACNTWQRATSYGGVEPLEPTHSGSGMAWYNSWDMYWGNEVSLVSPTMNFSTYTGGTNVLTFWMYRSYDIGGGWYGNESDWIDAYIYSPSYGYYYLTTVYDGINNSPSVSSEGWYQYTITLPTFFNSYSSVNIVLDANSNYGVDMYVDDVSVNHVPPPITPCSGTPSVAITTVPNTCANTPFTLTATTTPSPISGITYQWQSAPTATGPWTSIPGATNTTYSTSLTTTTYFMVQALCSNSGLTGNSNIDGTVVNPNPSTPVVSSNSPVCAGASYNPNNLVLSSTSTGTSVSYTWTGPNGYSVTNSTSTTQTISSPSLAAAGTYTVYASTIYGCTSASASTNVVVNVSPVKPISTTGFASYCQFDPGATALSATGANLQWYTAATGGVPSTTAPTPSTTSAGLFFWYVTQTVSGCESPARIDTVLVKTKPTLPYTTLSFTYCQGDNAPELTAIGANLLWYVTATGGVGSAVAPTPSTAVAGTFTYYVTQTVNGCESDRVAINILVKAKPSAPNAPSKNYCQGDFALPLTASGSNLLWYTTPTGGGGSSIAPKPVTLYADTSYYYVTSTVNGCESDRTQIRIIVDYTPNALIVASQPYVCQYDSLTFSYFGNATSSAVYNWSMPAGATLLHGIGQGPMMLKFDSAGKRIVSLQVINGICKSPVTTYVLDVRLAPNVPTNISKDVCQGQVLNVSLGYANEQIDNFNWDFDGAQIVYGTDGGGPYGITWSTSGQHIITMVANTNSCPSIPVHDTVNVHGLADAHIGDVSNANICAGDSVMFTAERYNAGYLYQWYPAIYFGTQTNSGQVYGYIERSGYVTLQVTTEFGCTSQDSTLISAQPCCEVYFPNAFTPNGDGKNDIFRPITKGNQVIKSFRVTNRWGQVMFETVNSHEGWDGKFNGVMQDLGTYYYYIKYQCANGKIYDEKGEIILLR